MVVVVGSINIDHAVSMPRFPAEGETLLGTDYQALVGGKGANQAVAAARAGAETSLTGAVGDDNLGQQALEFLDAQALNLSNVRVDNGTQTGLAAIWVTSSGENSICVIPGANHRFTPAHLSPGLVTSKDTLLLQGEIPAETSIRAAQLAKDAGARVVLNLAPALKLGRDAYDLVDVLVVNEREAGEVLGTSAESVTREPEDAARELSQLVPTSIITLGQAGVVCCDARQVTRYSAFPVTAVDTTGAGDAFVGNLAAILDRGAPLPQAIEWAAAAAALAVTVLGATPSLPLAHETAAFLRNRSSAAQQSMQPSPAARGRDDPAATATRERNEPSAQKPNPKEEK